MIKKIIKKIPGFEYLNKKRINFDFNRDKHFFFKNYMYSKPITKEKLEYDMLFEIHKLEKGFAVSQNIRPFGIDKIKRIIRDILEYEKRNYKPCFAYNLSYSSLYEYKSFFEKHNWVDRDEYTIVLNFLNEHNNKAITIPVGAFNYKKESFINDALIDYDKFISTRRSVRNFSKKSLSDLDVQKAILTSIKTPTACNRQMCKIYYIKSDNNKDVVIKYAQGLGLFDLTNANYFVITFDVSSNYFIGERNQGWFNSGLVTMNFINALHSLGIGSCCIQFGNTFKEETEFKKQLDIPENERIGVIVVAGYYDDISRVPFSTRKPIDEIYRER